MSRLKSSSCICLSFVLLFFLAPMQVVAKSFDVDTTLDEVDLVPGDGVCRTESETCSLRAAVMEANALAGFDEIYLQAEQYDLTIEGIDEDLSLTGDLDIIDAVSIIGKGPSETVITGSFQFRIFSILPRNDDLLFAVSIEQLTLTQGIPNRYGAVILNEGILSLDNVVVENAGDDPELLINTPALHNLNARLLISNSSFRDNSHAIYSENASVQIEDSEFRGNKHSVSANEGGAAIYAEYSALSISATTFEDNDTPSSGGAIYAVNSVVDLVDVLFNDNSAGKFDAIAFGGALFLYRSSAKIDRSIFTGNEVGGSGGAISHAEGSLSINRSQLRSNIATSNVGSVGGAIVLEGAASGNAVVTIEDSVIFGNFSNAVGGGIGSFELSNAAEEINIINSEISGNGSDYGGGIYLAGQQETYIVNTTISNNFANTSSAGIYFGALASSTLNLLNVTMAFNEAKHAANLYNYRGKINLVNTIISDPVFGNNCEGDITSLGYNLASDSSCALDTQKNDFVGTNPLLSDLADNGGSTQTHALGENSKAIDNANSALCAEAAVLDQRYYYRNDGSCDIGAFEQNSALAQRGILSFSSATSFAYNRDSTAFIAVSRTDGAETAIYAIVSDTRSGTAVPNEDYNFSRQYIYWADGDSADKTFSVPLLDGSLSEQSKSISLQLVSASNGVSISDDNTHEIEILDGQSSAGVVEFGESLYSVEESEDYVDLFLVRKNGSNGKLVFSVSTSDGTAIDGRDYSGGLSEITIPDGQLTYRVRVPLERGKDNIYDKDKVFYLTISASNDEIVGELNTTTVYIIDDDVEPENPGEFSFELDNYTVNESSGMLDVNILRKNGAEGDMLLYLVVNDGTAKFGADITAIQGVSGETDYEIFMRAGSSSLSLELEINDDDFSENSENLTLSLVHTIGGANIGSIKTTTVTILDDDPVARISFEKGAYTVSEDAGYIEIEIVRFASGDIDASSSITVSAASGTAVRNKDFTMELVEIYYSGSQATQILRVDISKASNDIVEGNRSFTLKLSKPSNSDFGLLVETTITLIDNDIESDVEQPNDKLVEDSSKGGEAVQKSKGAASLNYFLLVIFLLKILIMRRVK